MSKLRALAISSFMLVSPAFAGGPPLPPPAPPASTPGPVPAIPEPAALALFVLGVGVVGVAMRRRKS